MVIGNGLLANRFSSYASNEAVVIFASGVSDSKTNNLDAFEREHKLLIETLKSNPGKLLVYFSTCSVLDKSLLGMPYTSHKLAMENVVKQSGSPYLIFRISNLVGRGGNPKTIMNYLVQQVKDGTTFNLWQHAYRNLIDLDDAYALMDFFIATGEKNRTINIANPVSYSSIEIVNEIEKFLKKKANYLLVNEGELFFIDTSVLQPVAKQLSIPFDQNYLQRLLKKYYTTV